MKKFGARGRLVLKIIHLTVAGLWLGGALTLNLMVAVLGPGRSGGELLGYDLARKFVDDFIIIPGAFGCLLSGLAISLGTAWGFFKHRWVAMKWLLTVACILFGTFYLGPRINGQPLISQALGLAAAADPLYLANRVENMAGGWLQMIVLVFMVVISVLKPWKKRAGGSGPAKI
ncbi:MAG: hypothetical protein LBV21_01035 [Candidatus Adiutrix sp.]|jgi:hypothetical protein|nr:hypothetical protein [Candidatus Adiutrix sp.]